MNCNTTHYRANSSSVPGDPTRPVEAATAATYDADLARDLRALPAGSTALVVGHSNTVPGIVAAISGQPAAEMPETEFDRYTVIVLDKDGKARVFTSRY